MHIVLNSSCKHEMAPGIAYVSQGGILTMFDSSGIEQLMNVIAPEYLKSAMEQGSNIIDTLNNQNKELQDKLDKGLNQCIDQQLEIDELKKDASRNSRQVDCYASANKQLHAKLEQAEQELHVFRSGHACITNLQACLDGLQHDNDELKKSLKSRDIEIMNKSSLIKINSDQIQGLYAEITKLQEENKALKDQRGVRVTWASISKKCEAELHELATQLAEAVKARNLTHAQEIAIVMQHVQNVRSVEADMKISPRQGCFESAMAQTFEVHKESLKKLAD